MSAQFASEHACYVNCNYCNTILVIMLVPSEEEDRCRHAIVKLAAASPGGSEVASARKVNVPNSCSHNIVTVKCGHCTMVLSMDLSPFHQQARTVPDNQVVQNRGFQYNNFGSYEQASSRNLRTPSMYPVSNNQPQVPPIRPPEKRQRVPSAYNRFIKEEIQRIKMSNPEISHREAFSAAAKNWAHLPRLHFGLSVADGSGSN